MKAILLAGLVLASSSLTSFAQNSQAPATSQPQQTAQKVITREIFSAQTKEYTTLLRENPNAAMNKFMELAASMQRSIYLKNEQMNKSEGGTKAQLKKVIDQQNQIYSQLKMMSSDGAKNQKEMEKKFEEFKMTL